MGFFGEIPGNTRIWPFLAIFGDFGHFWPFSPFSRIWYRGAPARGVDVKPPSRRGLGSGNPQKGGFCWFWSPLGLGETPGGPRGGPKRAWRPAPGPPGPRPGEGFTSTPRAGAPRFPGSPLPGSGVRGYPRAVQAPPARRESPTGVDGAGLPSFGRSCPTGF